MVFHNCLSLDSNEHNSIKKFSGIVDSIDHTNFHTWAYPVSILEEEHEAPPNGNIEQVQKSTLVTYHAMPRWLSSPRTKPTHWIYQPKIACRLWFSTVPYLQATMPPSNLLQLLDQSTEKGNRY